MTAILFAAVLPALTPASAQIYDTTQDQPSFGTRHIDTLPRSDYAEDVWSSQSWWSSGDDDPARTNLAIHTRPSFRVGRDGMERLCVIEAVTPNSYRQTAILRFNWPGKTIERNIHWLAHKTQYRPIWLTVLPAEGRASLVRDQNIIAQCEFDTATNAPTACYDVSVPAEPNYVDYGYGLMPSSWMIARPGQPLKVRFAANPQYAGKTTLTAALTGGNAGISHRETRTFDSALAPVTALRISTIDLRPGTYHLHCRARLPSKNAATAERTIHLIDPRPPPDFGAHYTNLRYPAPVYVSLNETASWDDLWRESGLRDVVVTWPGRDRRFVFWRGTSYVPCWAFNNAWLTYEWLEAEPDYYGAVGCVEPIMDKACRYSRARILSATPARVVIHWEYALTDFNQKVIRDERADEYYYFYPDGAGTRKLVAWIESGWHENQEFIALNRPGNAPHKSLQPNAVTFLTADGDSERPVWPRPFLSVDDWPHVIARVNIPGRPSPFMVIDGPATYVKVWADPYIDKPGLFNTYIHWPISRGIRTTWLDDPKLWSRPTHSNLINVVHDEAVAEDDYKIWYWLIGLCETERAVRRLAGSWLEPGAVSAKPGTYSGYDRSQRAYIFQAPSAGSTMTISVTPGEYPIVNPAFVIESAGSISKATCPAAQRIETGTENAGRDLIVWLEGLFDAPFELTLH